MSDYYNTDKIYPETQQAYAIIFNQPKLRWEKYLKKTEEKND